MEVKNFLNFSEDQYMIAPHQGFSTKAIHEGQDKQPFGAVNVPLFLSTTFEQEQNTQFSHFFYSRCGNPTREAYEKCLASLEYGKHCIALASGMQCMTVMFHVLNSGDHIIVSDDVYGGINHYARDFAKEKLNFKIDFADFTNLEELQNKIKPQETKMIWFETPSNPTLKIIDIEAVAQLVKKIQRNIIIVVDNTFCSPYLQSPIKLGADVAMHSVTKYIGGHADVCMGSLIFNDTELYNKAFQASVYIGSCPSIFDCYLALRGLKTLEVRMKMHCKNAYSIARFLSQHPYIDKVIYTGLENHPGNKIAKKQMKGYGGIISFYIKGGKDETNNFIKNLQYFKLAVSLGSCESLLNQPFYMTHSNIPLDQRQSLGITENFIRISVGIESLCDLINDLDQALQKSCKK